MPGILIIKDERNLFAGRARECKNCGEMKPGRQVEAFGHMGESRGWYFLCFDCFGPRVFWKEKGLKQAQTWASPAKSFGK